MRLELPQYYTGDEQLRQVYAYLTRTVDKLNYALSFLDIPETSGDAGIRAEDPNNKSIVLSEKSTNTQYPSAKAVVDYAVPKTRSINGNTLENDITLNAEDVGAVPTARKINGYTLDADVDLTAEDVDAVPTIREINGYPLSEDVNLTAEDLGEAEYVTETGASGNWTWRKWSSGTVELWNHMLELQFSAGSAFTSDLYFATGSFVTPIAIEYNKTVVIATPLNPADSFICGGAAMPQGMMLAAARKTNAAGSLYLQVYVRGKAAV